MALANGDRHFIAPQNIREMARDLTPLMNVMDNEGVLVWGWDHAIKAQLLRMGIDADMLPTDTALTALRTCSERKAAHHLLSAFRAVHSDGPYAGESLIAHNIDNIAAYATRHEHIILKDPLSSSGKGLRHVNINENEDFLRDALSSSLNKVKNWSNALVKRHGYLTAEPYYDKVQDFAMEFCIREKQCHFIGYSLYRILTSLDSRCNWYNYDRLIDITERVKMKEDFAQLQNEYYRVENEMLALQNADIEQKKHELEELEKDSLAILESLESSQKLHEELSTEKENLQNIMSLINSASAYSAEKSRLVSAIESKTSELEEISDKIGKISSNLQNIKIIEGEVASLGMIYTETNNRAMKLRMTLQEIASTKSSYQEYLDERNTLKLILDAVSSKDGIPLIMVKVFLDECKEIINDLISDIFEDDLEIVDFDISETSNEFKIPYKINGNYVPDVELASQGQNAVISIALSFALCRKSMFDYNIMLLDEIDNSIYKADREKFIMILAKQMQALGTEQVFLITHNDIFQQTGLPVNIIMTTREIIDSYPNQSIMHLY